MSDTRKKLFYARIFFYVIILWGLIFPLEFFFLHFSENTYVANTGREYNYGRRGRTQTGSWIYTNEQVKIRLSTDQFNTVYPVEPGEGVVLKKGFLTHIPIAIRFYKYDEWFNAYFSLHTHLVFMPIIWIFLGIGGIRKSYAFTEQYSVYIVGCVFFTLLFLGLLWFNS